MALQVGVPNQIKFLREIMKNFKFYHISVECVKKTPKMTPGDPKNEKIDPRVTKMAPKYTKSEPFGAKRSPKGSQREPKGSLREPKGPQKGAKSEPRGDQNASKNRSSEKIPKMMEKGSPHRDEMDDFWEPFSIKNR